MENNEIEILMKEIKKNFGKESIFNLNNKEVENIDVISSGSLIIDNLLGIKGFPKGRIVEIFGPESSGKTSIALSTIASANKNGNGVCAFIDAEHSLDLKHAQKIGVDVSKLIVSQPDSAEQALDIVEFLLKTNKFDVIVIDSVAALTPLAEIEGKMDEHTIGLQARLIAKSLRKLVPLINKTNTIVIFINQIREKVGVIFGNPEITPGGRSLKFFSSIRMDLRIKERKIINGNISGQLIKVKIIKNKLSIPYKEDFVYFDYEEGFDKVIELIDLSTKLGIIKKSGSWYYYGDLKLGHGKIETKNKILSENIYDEILKKII